MKHEKIFYLIVLLFMTLTMASCSENDNTVEEYPNWKAKNEVYFNTLYATTQQKIASGDTSWKIIPNFSLQLPEKNITLKPENNIIVEVLKEGKGSGCPIYTDNVRCHYMGRLLPSTSHIMAHSMKQRLIRQHSPSTAVLSTALPLPCRICT